MIRLAVASMVAVLAASGVVASAYAKLPVQPECSSYIVDIGYCQSDRIFGFILLIALLSSSLLAVSYMKLRKSKELALIQDNHQ